MAKAEPWDRRSIRPAAVADAESIAVVHGNAWFETYRGLVPEKVLTSWPMTARAERWRAILGRAAAESPTFVATDDGGNVVGFGCGGPRRSTASRCEAQVYGIYILRRGQNQGLGRGLMRAMACCLAAAGHRSLIVEAMRENYPARRFYQALGGELGGEGPDSFNDFPILHVWYYWPDLRRLIDGR